MMRGDWSERSLVAVGAAMLVTVASASPIFAQEGTDIDELTQGVGDDSGGEQEVAELTDLSLEQLLDRDMARSIAPGLGGLAETLDRGQLKLDYSLEADNKSTILDGTEPVTSGEVVTSEENGGYGYVLADTEMQTFQHSLSVSYAPIDRITLVGRFGYVEHVKEELYRTGDFHEGRSDSYSALQSRGLSDATVQSLVRLVEGDNHRIHASVGTTLPIGSTDERGPDTTQGTDQLVLSYPMQPGTGTFNIVSGLTYRGLGDDFGWGAQARGFTPLGANEHGYAPGSRYGVSVWGSALWTEALSSFVVLQGAMRGNIAGRDVRMRSQFTPQSDPSLQEYQRITTTVGIALDGEVGSPLEDLRMELYAGMPLYRNHEGPQLAMDTTAGLSVSYLVDTHE